MNYVEVQVHADVDSGEVMALFTKGEPAGAWESAGVVHLFWPEEAWTPGLLVELRSILARLGVADHPRLTTVAIVPDQDWNESWARSLQPIRIGDGIVIRQSWNRVEGAPPRVELVIDPKRAFGSGYHATTQLLLEWLQQEIRGGERVLDVGTGSGILAMSALRLGAVYALGIDNDAVAVECAREYAALNTFGPELQLRAAELAGLRGGTYDIVVANLDRRALLPAGGQLVKLLAPGGRLLVSGLQHEDYADMVEALPGAAVVARRNRDEWIALMIRKQQK